jgi:hypothetical protein
MVTANRFRASLPSVPDRPPGEGVGPVDLLASVASLPDRYEERLTPLWPGRFSRLALFALEAHDLALSKLARNSPIDREDVARLARTVPLDPALLRERYETELRPIIIGDLTRHDQTLALWLEAYFG